MTGISEPNYFFAGGIRFECTRCGHCCTGSPGRVRVTPDEITAIASLTGRLPADFLKAGGALLKEMKNGDCIFYDNGCRIYAARPAQCRTYPFWFKNLRSEEAWAQTCAACPGIGRGRLYSKDEIMSLIHEADDAPPLKSPRDS